MKRGQKEHFVLVKPYGVYVKEGQFFRSQGGLVQPWGRSWRRLFAMSIEDARKKGERLRNKLPITT